jgi:hypothetical protein
MSPLPELVFEDEKIRIERHSEPPAGFLELLERTIWGTGGVKYAMLDIAERLPKLGGGQFFALREDGALAGAYALEPRVLRVQGREVRGLYRSLLTVAPERGRRGLGARFASEVRRYALERAQGPLVLYGFMESENAAALALARAVGHEPWRAFSAAVFTRWSPRDDARVQPLGEGEAAELAGLLREAQRGHLAWDPEESLREAPCFVLREAGAIAAAAQVRLHRWRLDGLSGAAGFLVRRVMPILPGLRRFLDPDDLRFAFFGGLYAAPGQEKLLVRLLEALLARADLHAALMYLDPDGRPGAALLSGGGFGFLHALGLRAGGQVMASTAGISPELAAEWRRLPVWPTIADDL